MLSNLSVMNSLMQWTDCLVYFGCFIVFMELILRNQSIKNIMKYIFYQCIYGGADVFDDIVFKKANRTRLQTKTGQVAVVTGGARGIGIEVVKMLLQCDMHVVVGCRNIEAGKQVENQAREKGINTGSMECISLHLDSFSSIKEFSKTISQKYPKINILINNAGILSEEYEETVDGFESHFGVNYLGHFLLTHYLLPNLMEAGSFDRKSRIVNVSSVCHYFGDINFENINSREVFYKMMAYSQSKLAQVISTVHLNNLFKKEKIPVEVFSVNPGVVNTDMVKNVDFFKGTNCLRSVLLKNPKQGATPVVHSAISPKLNGKGGSYINNCRIKSINSKATDINIQNRLFILSKELVNIKEFGKPVYD